MSQLVVDQLRKSFNHREVVRGVSFKIDSKKVVGLLGPNGAGKTTSFYMVVGLVKPDDGNIILDDHNIAPYPVYKRARMGLSYLPQEPSVFRKLTVKENILVAIDAQGITGSLKQETLERLIMEFSLSKIVESYGYALSGGERRRVEIARALVGKPKFLLLDEPFAGIDPIAVFDIQEVIKKLRDQGIGILITDHNVRETLGICDYSYIMKDGEVQVEGTPESITQSKLARQFYLGENFRL